MNAGFPESMLASADFHWNQDTPKLICAPANTGGRSVSKLSGQEKLHLTYIRLLWPIYIYTPLLVTWPQLHNPFQQPCLLARDPYLNHTGRYRSFFYITITHNGWNAIKPTPTNNISFLSGAFQVCPFPTMLTVTKYSMYVWNQGVFCESI